MIAVSVDMGNETEVEELYLPRIDPRKKNELNDEKELAQRAENTKQSMY